MLALTINTTDLPPLDRFPEYADPYELEPFPPFPDMATSTLSPTPKMLGKILKEEKEPSRHPSPQPTHLSGPILSRANGNGHRVLRSATVGYIAPEFLGKVEQMKQGGSAMSHARSSVLYSPPF
jgi:glutamate dehydrogenase